MRVAYCLFTLLLVREINGATVRKPPAFATPVYSDSYLPATLQVTFHAVEQLRRLQIEEMQENTTALIPPTSSHAPGQYQLSTVSSVTEAINIPSTTEKEGNSKGQLNEEVPESSQVTPGANEETPEENQETPESNYATPETNYEAPENVGNANDDDKAASGCSVANDAVESTSTSPTSTSSTKTGTESSSNANAFRVQEDKDKKRPTIDSVVDEVYELVKPTAKKSDANIKFEMDAAEKSENMKEEEEETRFTLLGEKVSQVPRPSLSSYLKRAKIPPNSSLQQLALLYDSLNKDARKQGFGRYAGYSDAVLKDLESSAAGGAGVQLKTLLEKTVERNELTRDEAKAKANEVLRDLGNPASQLSTDLRRLLPLRYAF